MKRHKLRKRALTALLALSLFSTQLMTAQAAGATDYSVYENAGEHGYSGPSGSYTAGDAEVIFDTGNGPHVTASSLTGWHGVSQTGRFYVIRGQVGKPLNEIAPFNTGIAAFGDWPTSQPGGKPALPWGQGTTAAPSWTGYSFAGWTKLIPQSQTFAEEDEVKLTRGMDPVIPYNKKTIYRANWMGSANYKLFTTHGRKADAASEFAPWTFDRSDDDIVVSSAVSKGSVDLPGYKITGVTVKSTGSTDAAKTAVTDFTVNGASGLGPDGTAIPGDERFPVPSPITSPLLLDSNMPNQNVSMQFDYEPDTNQKFKFSTSYVYLDSSNIENSITVPDGAGGILGSAKLFATESDGAGVQNGTTRFTAALLPDANNPKDNTAAHHPKYVFYKAEIVSGKEKKTLSKTVVAGGTAETFVRQRGLEESLFDLQMPAVNAVSPTPVSFKWMPNQDVKVKYIYKLNPDYTNMVSIVLKSSRDNDISGFVDNNVPRPIIEKPTAPGSLTTVSIPYVPNYTVVSAIALDSAALTQQPHNLTQPTATTSGSFQYESTTDPATIVVRYQPNPSAFAKVYYTAKTEGGGTGGSLSGVLVQQMTMPKTYTLDELLTLHGISATPATGYLGDGWYKANASGTAPDGPKLSGTDLLSVTAAGSNKYIYVFKKNPADWGTVRFFSGANGSISGTAVQSVLKNTALSSLAPAVTANTGYQFEGWYDNAGNLVSTDQNFGSLTVQGNASYTAHFVLIAALSDTVFAVPNVDASVSGADGTGQLRVNTPNTSRVYTVTDLSGNVVATMTGLALSTGNFTGLRPGQPYHIYELTSDQNPAAETNISAVPANKKGPEALAVIPATQPNLTAVPDPSNNTASITVNPADANSQYALVDDAGNAVAPGFVSPSSSGVVFAGLDPARSYTVVAQPNGSAQNPAANAAAGYGTTVPAATQSATVASDTFTVKVHNDPANSGRLLLHTRAGATLQVSDEKEIDDAKSGDIVMLSADATDSTGAAFVRWQLLGGSVLGFNPALRSQSVTVSGNAVFEPIYQSAIGANQVELQVSSSDNGFGVAENIRRTKQDALNSPQLPEDNVWATNSNATYTIKLQKGAPSADVRQAVSQADGNSGEASFRFGWMLDVKLFRSLTRTADGAVLNRPVPEDAAARIADFTITTALNTAAIGKTDYALYAVRKNASGALTAVDLSSQLPADFATNPGAIYELPAEIGDKLVLTYHKAVKFRIIDGRTESNNATVLLRKGSAPAANTAYTALPLDFTQNLDNGKYRFVGLSKTAGSYTAFDPATDAVNTDLTVYAYYEVDPAWTAARAALDASRATGMAALPNVSDPTLAAALQAALNNAAAVSNATAPSSSIAAMLAAQVALDQAIHDASVAPTPAPAPTPTPIPTPAPTPVPTPGGGGSGGGGGGRGGRGGGRGLRGGTTPTGTGNRVYQNGVEGNWVNFDVAQHGWYFDLGAGKKIRGSWADVAYTYGGETKIYSYHFDTDGVMDSGWWKNDQGTWFHLSTSHDGWFGSMDKGWYHDSADGRWYYLNLLTGAMLTGWQQIDGVWYYFNPETPAPTWDWDSETNRWGYANRGGRPYGSMFAGEKTPDGYHVDASGVWIRETP